MTKPITLPEHAPEGAVLRYMPGVQAIFFQYPGEPDIVILQPPGYSSWNGHRWCPPPAGSTIDWDQELRSAVDFAPRAEPRLIEDPDQVDTLPLGTVVIDWLYGQIMHRVPDGWIWGCADNAVEPRGWVPMTVLGRFEP